MTFYSLLYVSNAKAAHVNLKHPQNAIDVYLKCAVALCNSCEINGVDFTLITNNKSAVQERIKTLQLREIPIYEKVFSRNVPHGVRFYAAHFKLDVISTLGSGDLGPIVGLVDLDMIALRGLPSLGSKRSSWIYVYPLQNYKSSDVRADLVRSGMKKEARSIWYGGEFLAGTSSAFSRLSIEIDKLWPRYLSNLSSMGHVGDEAIVSAAINNVMLDDPTIDVLDTMTKDVPLVARWWSARTDQEQIKLSEAERACFIHLPADKNFIASVAQSEPRSALEFMRRYRSYARRKILARRLASIFDIVMRKRKKRVPQL